MFIQGTKFHYASNLKDTTLTNRTNPNMPKQKNWSRHVSLMIREKMSIAAKNAICNGQDLLSDAELLLKNNRYARATALAILAEEEFSKAAILLNCAHMGRWDSAIFNAIHSHSIKQGFAEGFSKFMINQLANAERVDQLNSHAFIKSPPSFQISPQEIETSVRTMQSYQDSRPRDLLKQKAFYIHITDEVELQSTPGSIAENEAEDCIKHAKECEKIAHILARHFPSA